LSFYLCSYSMILQLEEGAIQMLSKTIEEDVRLGDLQ
jgi:hypothetical protein